MTQWLRLTAHQLKVHLLARCWSFPPCHSLHQQMTFAQLTWQPVSWLYIQTSLFWAYSSFWSHVNVTCGLILSIHHCSVTNECWLSVSDNDTSTVIGPDAVSYRMCPVHAHAHTHTFLCSYPWHWLHSIPFIVDSLSQTLNLTITNLCLILNLTSPS